MASLVKQRRKGTDTVYVYRSESVWIPGKGPRNKRTLIGKLDPSTGEVVPTGKRGRKKKEPDQPEQVQLAGAESGSPDASGSEADKIRRDIADVLAQSREAERTIAELERENAELRAEINQMHARMDQMAQFLQDMKNAVIGSLDQCLGAFQQDDGEDEG